MGASWRRQLVARLLVNLQERQHRHGIPAQVRARREQGPLPRPPLREPDHLARPAERPHQAHGPRSTRGPRGRPVLDRRRARRSPAVRDRDRLTASASIHHVPTHSAAADTSTTHSGSSRGIQASSQSCSPGPRYTAPPPPRRRASCTPRSRMASRPTSSVGCVLPSTRVGPATSRATASRRGSARNCSTSKSEEEEGNLRRPRRDTAPTTGPRPPGAATARGARRAEPA